MTTSWLVRLRDVALALALGAAIAAEAVTHDEGWVAAMVAALPALGLAVRRHLPELVPALLLAVLAAAGRVGLGDEALESLLYLPVWVVGAYSAGVHPDRRRSLGALLLWLLVCAALPMRVAADGADAAFNVLLVLCAWVPGVFVRHSRLRAAEAVRRAENERAAAADALVAERNRIARELHDVVAHAVGIMTVQAAAAEQVLPTDPERAREAMVTVQRTGRTAVAELSRMLGLLRGEEDWERAPLPTLAQVDSLVADAAAGGVTAHLSREGDLSGLPPAVDLSAYRIVQEALTNAAKHAPGSQVEVRVSSDGSRLTVEVENSAGAPHPRAAGSRHGLSGLRERVAIFGGTFEAGRTPRGFRVRASLPIGEALP